MAPVCGFVASAEGVEVEDQTGGHDVDEGECEAARENEVSRLALRLQVFARCTYYLAMAIRDSGRTAHATMLKTQQAEMMMKYKKPKSVRCQKLLPSLQY